MQTRTVGAFEARRQFGKLLSEVGFKGDTIVVEKNGEPIAAVVPIQLYEQWKRQREEFFARMQEAAESSQQYEELTEEEAMALANDAVQAARAEKRK